MSDNEMKPPLFGGIAGEPVPQVDPEDLKILWRTQKEIEDRHPGRQVALGRDAAQQICKTGADIQAVGYRVSLLWLLSQIAPTQFAFLEDGQPSDAAFRAAAKVRAEWMGEGITRQAPFDVRNFCGCVANRERRLIATGTFRSLSAWSMRSVIEICHELTVRSAAILPRVY